jgi:hypothetical protein
VQRAPFAHSIYYLRRQREAGTPGACWRFSFHEASGTVLLEALFPEIPKEARIFEPGHPESPLVRLKAWRWFWWNGRYDVVDPETGLVLATLRRTGGIEGPDRRSLGRVRNAMPLRKSLTQWFFIGILDAILSGGGDSSTIAVDEFRVEVRGTKVGALRRVRLPFLSQQEPPETANRTWLRLWLGRIRSGVRRHFNSGGWQLDFTDDASGILDPRVRLAAAMFRIQIEERYR